MMGARTLVIGGAGFIGSNLVSHLQSSRLRLTRADVRDFDAVQVAVNDADVIYHLAGQVAVTTSVTDPRSDFDINALGTLNVLEAARVAGHRPVIVFTSTNKVYGELEQVAVVEERRRYRFADR